MAQSGDPLLSLTAQIVVAHIEHNDVTNHALPALIRDVYQALATAGAPADQTATIQTGRKSANAQTVFDDYLVCLECGLHMKMLKRHLQSMHNATPTQYRLKWRLPGDYPMVAQRYAALRSTLAKDSGLGKRPVPRAP
jgi:predicted transcriptional regulator